MSDDNGFVERPEQLKKNNGGALSDRLRATAENGKAILAKKTDAGRRLKGYRIRTTQNGAPDGMVFMWAERIADEAPKP